MKNVYKLSRRMNGQFGTTRDGAECGGTVEAGSYAEAFEKGFGFVPAAATDSKGRRNPKWVPNTGAGFLRVDRDGRCMSAVVHCVEIA